MTVLTVLYACSECEEEVEFSSHNPKSCDLVLICHKCGKVIDVNDTLTMVSGYRGICTCPGCGHRNKVVKTRPNDTDYNVSSNGTRTRKIPKSGMKKKQRRKLNKELKNG